MSKYSPEYFQKNKKAIYESIKKYRKKNKAKVNSLTNRDYYKHHEERKQKMREKYKRMKEALLILESGKYGVKQKE